MTITYAEPIWKERSTFATSMYFLMIGPLIGFTIIFAGLLFFLIPKIATSGPESFFGGILIMLCFGLPTAYIVGSIPALITGIVSNQLTKKDHQLVLASIAGAITCSTATLLINAEPAFIACAGLFGGFCGFITMIKRHAQLER